MKFQSYDADTNNIDALNKELDSDDHVFILVYMNGCAPCNNTKPHWYDLEPTLKDQYNKRDDISVIDVERTHLPNIKEIGSVEGFPTIKYMNKKTGEKEDYEGARTTDEFVKWIESKIDHVNSSTSNDAKNDSMNNNDAKNDSKNDNDSKNYSMNNNELKNDSMNNNESNNDSMNNNDTNKLKSELLESISNQEQNYNNIIKNSSLSGEKSSSASNRSKMDKGKKKSKASKKKTKKKGITTKKKTKKKVKTSIKQGITTKKKGKKTTASKKKGKKNGKTKKKVKKSKKNTEASSISNENENENENDTKI